MLMNIIVLAQLAATLVVGVYFFRQMRAQSAPERAAHSGGKAQAEWKRLNALRRIHLSEPLSEQARPTRLEDIVGQGDAVEALMAVLSGPHPQHGRGAGRGQNLCGPAGPAGGKALGRNAIFAGRAVYRNGRHLCAL